MPANNVRAIAAKILSNLLNGQGSLTTQLSQHQTNSDFALLQQLCFGSCRWFILLETLLQPLLDKPLKSKDQDIKCLLIVGLHQLRDLRIPDHAAINETVNAATVLKKRWAKGLVNAVLRQFQRRRQELESLLEQSSESKRFSHPPWFFQQLQQQWPNHWAEIVASNNTQAPMTLRNNQLRQSRADALSMLGQGGISASEGTLGANAIYLDKACAVDKLPGFVEGGLSVQDEASQLVAPLLELKAGLRVLDACAAPGGKSCHVLELAPGLEQLVAIDIDSRRLQRIQENLDRLKLNATLVVADAANLGQWWDGRHFDRILLDVPCSATGVIRRHPDIKLLRSLDDISALNRSQLTLLKSVWPSLKPGGKMLYSSCSVLRQENEDIIAQFLQQTDSAKYEAITADWGVECQFGRQLLPQQNSHDGFYYCLLKKSDSV